MQIEENMKEKRRNILQVVNISFVSVYVRLYVILRKNVQWK